MAFSVSRSSIGEPSITGRRKTPCLVLHLLMALLVLSFGAPRTVSASLTYDQYLFSCPRLEHIVRRGVRNAYKSDTRIAASLLRLQFHDCFVNGCDASILLKDTATFSGEQSAIPNLNSVRGFDVIDNIKSAVEAACPKTVSCADILTIAARDSVVLAGGPYWEVQLGRYDSFSASQSDANNHIPPAFDNFTSLSSSFGSVGLSTVDLVALSGAHSIGKARCISVDIPGNSRLYNWSENSDFTSGTGKPDPHIDSGFLASLKANCPQGGDGSVLNNLDISTPTKFDNSYFKNLIAQKGLLNSDQAIYYQDGFSQSLVLTYAHHRRTFFNDFITSMTKMGNIGPKSSSNGEIRTQCGFPN